MFTHFVDPSPFNFREPPVDWYAEEGILPTRIPVLLLHLLRLNSTSVTGNEGWTSLVRSKSRYTAWIRNRAAPEELSDQIVLNGFEHSSTVFVPCLRDTTSLEPWWLPLNRLYRTAIISIKTRWTAASLSAVSPPKSLVQPLSKVLSLPDPNCVHSHSLEQVAPTTSRTREMALQGYAPTATTSRSSKRRSRLTLMRKPLRDPSPVLRANPDIFHIVFQKASVYRYSQCRRTMSGCVTSAVGRPTSGPFNP
jgi:hypothetical protein